MTDLPNDRRLNRPRISIGSFIGFTTLLGTSLFAIIGAAMWVGALDRSVTDLTKRVDRSDSDQVAFVNEMRKTLSDIGKDVTQLRVDVAGRNNATLHR